MILQPLGCQSSELFRNCLQVLNVKDFSCNALLISDKSPKSEKLISLKIHLTPHFSVVRYEIQGWIDKSEVAMSNSTGDNIFTWHHLGEPEFLGREFLMRWRLVGIENPFTLSGSNIFSLIFATARFLKKYLDAKSLLRSVNVPYRSPFKSSLVVFAAHCEQEGIVSQDHFRSVHFRTLIWPRTWIRAPPIIVRKYVDNTALLPCWPQIGQQVLHQRWVWGIHCAQATKYISEGYQWLHKKDWRPPKYFL